MTDQLLTIKLYAPPLRPGLVSRTRLVNKLNQALQQGSKLTLFSAPAGYGKTTLLLGLDLEGHDLLIGDRFERLSKQVHAILNILFTLHAPEIVKVAQFKATFLKGVVA